MTAMDFELERDAFGRLVLVLPAAAASPGRHAGVQPVRAFPLSAPGEGLSLVGLDGKELLWIERLDALQPPLRALLDEELAAREFTPVIEQLLSVSSFSTPSTWHVRTDRGETRFVLRGEEDIRRVRAGALLIASAQGIHFSVPDRTRLDRASRRLLERFL